MRIRLDRETVYDIIDEERDYQDKKWNNDHSIEEWFTYMESYLNEGKESVCRVSYEEGMPKALDCLRKVTALGVAAMENLGATRRD